MKHKQLHRTLRYAHLAPGHKRSTIAVLDQIEEAVPSISATNTNRVLVPGGRVILSVWKGASAYSIAVSAAIEKHVDAETATRFHASKVVPSVEELRHLLVTAAFQDVDIQSVALTIHVPPIEQYVPMHLAATPIAAVIEALSDETHTALVKDAAIALQTYVAGDGAALSEETHIVTACT